jgi:DNA polymerase-1
VLFDRENVFEKFGVWPEQMADYKALAGDSSDNFGGAPGIGKKTAQVILKKYGSVEGAYAGITAEAENFLDGAKKGQKIKDILSLNKERILMCKKLAMLDRQAPIEFSLGECRFDGMANVAVARTLENFGFSSLAKRLSSAADRHENGRLF